MIYINLYISDLHFGCTNSFEGRTLEHDKLIIDNWNRIVTNKDDVWILGDIGRIGTNKENEYLCQCLSVLKGNKHLILGNHDHMKDIRISQLFTEICDYKKITDNFDGKAYKLILSHYPILFWEGQHRGNIMLYGHLHESNEYTIYKECLGRVNEYFKDKTLKGYTDCPPAKAFNVGCSLPYINYTPRTLKEIIEKGDK